MRQWIKKFLGINDLENKLEEASIIDEDMKNIYSQIKIDVAIAQKNLSDINKLMENSVSRLDNLESKVNVRVVNVKFKNWNSEQEFIELSTRIYVLDNGYRKENNPFVKSDENGRVDEYDTTVGPDSKMRCYMLKKLVLVGYGNPEDFIAKGVEKCNFEYFFGKSYRELVSYMVEFNYEKLDEGISTLNFYEI